MEISPTLKLSLKPCDPIVKDFINYLKSENAKLQKEIAKLEAYNLTKENKINLLESELKKKPEIKTEINFIPVGNDSNSA